MSVKLLTEYHLEFLSLKGGSTSSSESTLVKMPHCWKSHVVTLVSKDFSGRVFSRLSYSIVNEPRHVISNNVAV